MMHYLILGAGVAGRRAAELIRRRDTGAEIVLVDEAPDPLYYKPMLGESLSLGPRYVPVVNAQRSLFGKTGVRLITGVKVASVDTDRQEVLCNNGQTLRYDRLLVASGSKTVRPPWDTGTVSGIAYFDTLEDAHRIASTIGAVRAAIVSGSSIQALDVLKGLRRRGIDCIYLLEHDRFWPGVLDAVASEIIESRIRQEAIPILKQSVIKEILVEHGKCKGVRTSRGEKIDADLVVVAAQQAPVLDFLQASGCDIDRALLVDESLRTNRENVFAAGEAAQPLLASTHIHAVQPGWLNAWRQGTVAGTTMSGEHSSYHGVLSLQTKAFDLDVISLGLSDAQGHEVREESGDFPSADLPYIYKKIVFKDRRVAGAIFVGDVGEAGVVERWIREGLPEDQCDNSIIRQMFDLRSCRTLATGALCPVCKFQIQVEDTYKEGDIVTCPACGMEFRLARMPNGVFRADLVRE